MRGPKRLDNITSGFGKFWLERPEVETRPGKMWCVTRWG